MLHKQYRLPSNTRLQKSSFFKTPLFVVKIAENGLTHNRYAFVVRKAVDKRAVVRNRIRRLFRSCIEELFDEILTGKDMLFFLERDIIEKSQQELCQELRGFMEEKQLLNKQE